MGTIEQRILAEGVHLENGEVYMYSYLFNTITKPADAFPESVDTSTSFILAHELGHYYQYKNKFLRGFYSSYRWSEHCFFNVLFYPIVILTETDAWVRAWRICKEEKIDTTGFWRTLIGGYGSYLKTYLQSIFDLIVTLIRIAIAVMLLLGVAAFSDKLGLPQTETIIALREALNNNNGLASALFPTLYLLLFLS